MLESNKTPQLSLTPEVADPPREPAGAGSQPQSVPAAPAQEKAWTTASSPPPSARPLTSLKSSWT